MSLHSRLLLQPATQDEAVQTENEFNSSFSTNTLQAAQTVNELNRSLSANTLQDDAAGSRQTRLASFVAYAKAEIAGRIRNTDRAKDAARAAAALEKGYAEFLRTEGDSDPHAQAVDYMLAIAEFANIARQEAVNA